MAAELHRLLNQISTLSGINICKHVSEILLQQMLCYWKSLGEALLVKLHLWRNISVSPRYRMIKSRTESLLAPSDSLCLKLKQGSKAAEILSTLATMQDSDVWCKQQLMQSGASGLKQRWGVGYTCLVNSTGDNIPWGHLSDFTHSHKRLYTNLIHTGRYSQTCTPSLM